MRRYPKAQPLLPFSAKSTKLAQKSKKVSLTEEIYNQFYDYGGKCGVAGQGVTQVVAVRQCGSSGVMISRVAAAVAGELYIVC